MEPALQFKIEEFYIQFGALLVINDERIRYLVK